jgi:uroporphyrinogen-III synthase
MIMAPPLAGKRIIVTRAEDHAQELCQLLRARGAEPIAWPVLRIDAAAPKESQHWTRAVAAADWIVFCSANGVKHALPKLASAWPAPLRVAAVGPKTAQMLAAHGHIVDAQPAIYQAENIVAALRAVQADLRAARVLVIKGTLSPNDLSEALRASGAQVSELIAYQTLPTGLPAPPLGTFDAITFASGSAARFAALAFGANLPNAVCAACIGPYTTQAALAAGWTINAQARVHSISGLVDALEEHFRVHASAGQ